MSHAKSFRLLIMIMTAKEAAILHLFEYTFYLAKGLSGLLYHKSGFHLSSYWTVVIFLHWLGNQLFLAHEIGSPSRWGTSNRFCYWWTVWFFLNKNMEETVQGQNRHLWWGLILLLALNSSRNLGFPWACGPGQMAPIPRGRIQRIQWGNTVEWLSKVRYLSWMIKLSAIIAYTHGNMSALQHFKMVWARFFHSFCKSEYQLY